MSQKIASLYAEIGANTVPFEQGVAKVKGSLNGLGSSMGSLGNLIKGALSFGAISGGLTMVENALKNSIKSFADYASQVEQVQRSLGSTSQEASRLIQIGDDVGISYDKMATAMRLAQKNGVQPNIEGLKKLADQYNALPAGVARTKLLLDTFGRSGASMGALLEKGATGIDKLNKGVEASLVLDEKAIRLADDYRSALDMVSDALKGLEIFGGKSLTAFFTDSFKGWTMQIRLLEKIKETNTSVFDNKAVSALAAQVYQETEAEFAVRQLTQTTGDFSTAETDNKKAVDQATQALDDYKQMLDNVSQANQDAESFIQSYADFQKGYVKDHAAAMDDVAKAEAKLAEARAKNYGKGPNAGMNQKGAIADATAGLADARKAVQDLEATWHESTNKMIYDMVLAKVSVDGLTNAEFKATQDLAVQMGIRSQADADAAKTAMDKAQSIADGIALQEDVMKEKAQTDANLLQLENDKQAAADGTTAAIVDGATVGSAAMQNLTQTIDSGTQSLIAMAKAASETSAILAAMQIGYGVRGGMQGPPSPRPNYHLTATQQPFGPVAGTKDNGGMGFAGQSYLIGTGAQPEIFTPSTNGMFTPANKTGQTINITVNNPKKEAAENSIRKSLKSLSYAGVAA